MMLACLDGTGDHGDDGDVDGGQDVEHGEDELHLDGPLPLGVLPPQPRQAEHRQPDAHLVTIRIMLLVLLC